MSNIPISQLPAAGALTGAEAVPAVQGGVTVQTTAVAIANTTGAYPLITAHIGTGGTAHALATESVAGFMSAGDKTVLDYLAGGNPSLGIVNSVAGLQNVIPQQAGLNALAGAVTAGSYLRGNGANVAMSPIQAADVPTLNQSTTGNAGTATKLQTAQAINGVNFDGSAPITITANDPNALTAGTHLTGGPFNGSAPVTMATDATSASTPGTLVARDGSGNFSAGTITASLTGNVTGNVTGNASGNAGTATKLQTAQAINGVGFDGSAPITITADTPSALTAGTHLTGGPFNGSAPVTLATDATSASTPGTLVARDGSGNFSAGTITASLTGNASGTAANITGVAAIANGGTGSATAAAARVALGTVGKINTQTFTASGTYTPSANLLYAIIEGVGGGGGGGGVSNTASTTFLAASGGGGGGYSRSLVSAATVGANLPVTIGAAGAGASAGANLGSPGGTTSVGTLMVAYGGNGGNGISNGSSSPATAGGSSGTGNQVAAPGGNSGSGVFMSGATFQILIYTGGGGDSVFGAGGRQAYNSVGSAGTGYGSGGAGGCFYGSSSVGGSNGAPGYVVITEFIAS